MRDTLRRGEGRILMLPNGKNLSICICLADPSASTISKYNESVQLPICALFGT